MAKNQARKITGGLLNKKLMVNLGFCALNLLSEVTTPPTLKIRGENYSSYQVT